ncbi:hypothetical protein ACU4GD_06880 [Cupriavidus basilensis]
MSRAVARTRPRGATIRDLSARYGITIDTHTADGIKVAREHLTPGVPMLVLETALPAKFADTIREALGHEPGASGQLRRHRKPAAALRGGAGRGGPDRGLHRRPHGPVGASPCRRRSCRLRANSLQSDLPS